MSYNNSYNYSRKRQRQDDFDGESSSPARSYRRYNNADSPQSNYRGRGRGGGYHQSMQPVQLSGAQRFKNDFWRMGESPEGSSHPSKFGDINPSSLLRMSNVIKDVYARPELGPGIVHEMMAVASTELPHKLPQFAAILALLAVSPVQMQSLSNGQTDSNSNIESTKAVEAQPAPSHPSLPLKPNFEPGAQDQAYAETTENVIQVDSNGMNQGEGSQAEPNKVNLAHALLGQLSQNLANVVASKNWQNARYIIRLFSLCAVTQISSVDPNSVIIVLADLAQFLTNEDVKLRVRDTLATIIAESVTILRSKTPSSANFDKLIQALKTYSQDRLKNFGQKERTRLFGPSHHDPVAEILDIAVSSTVERLPFVDHTLSIPELQTANPEAAAYSMSPLVVPIASLSADARHPVLGRIRLFADDTVPQTLSIQSYWLRQIAFDMMEVYAENRKECARLLLDLGGGSWLDGRLFKTKDVQSNGQPVDGDVDMNGHGSAGTYILENIVVECLLSSLLASPQAPNKTVFYASLLAEMCKLSPSTVAPAMGKCVRKIYADLDQANTDVAKLRLDAQALRVFTEWFSVHLSNFSFTWRWPEWQGDVNLPDTHPKKSLINRVLELETRLSYYDRVKATLPEPYVAAGIMSGSAPTVTFGYDNKEHQHYATAQDILSLIRGKSSSEAVQEEIEKAKQSLGESAMLDEEISALINDIVFQSILLVGSKSFSHFLNVIERYISLLKPMTDNSTARVQLLQTVASFFNSQQQFAFIVIDKLLRYRIVDPIDVVNWMFTSAASATSSGQMHNPSSWALLECALTLATGRVKLLNERLTMLQELNAEKMVDEDAADNTAKPDADLLKVEKSLHNLEREAKAVLKSLARHLHSTSKAGDAAQIWWTLGWTSELGRSFGEHLAAIEDEISGLLDDSECGQIYTAAILMAKNV